MYTIGRYVKLKNSNLSGKVLNIKNTNNRIFYKLYINNKNIIVEENDIENEIEYKEKNKNPKVSIITNTKTNFDNELMIRHLTKDEANIEIERFIDKALINNIKIIKIIHGKNGGVLRNLTHNYLKNCEYVKDFRLGYPHEGSYGVTIALLK